MPGLVGPSRVAIALAPSKGGGVDPAGSSPLRYWKASQIAGADGAAISSWPDLSAANDPAVQATSAQRPTLDLDGANGQPGVVFDGADDVLGFSRVTTARTLLQVIRFSRPFKSFAPLIGDTYNADKTFLGGAADSPLIIVSPFGASANGVDADTRLNGKPVGRLAVQPRPTQLAVVAVRTASAFAATSLSYGGTQSRYFGGVIAETILWDRYVSDAELAGYERWLCARYGIGYQSAIGDPKASIVFDGDSLTYGVGSTSSLTYPNQLLALLTGGAPYYANWNTAIGGSSAGTILSSRYDATVAPLRAIAFPKDIYAVWSGTNDLGGGVSGATLYTTLKGIWAKARADGRKVIAFTITPRSGTGVSAGFETQRGIVNTAIRSDPTLYDGLVDVAADSRIGDAGDELDATYYVTDGDGGHVHFNNTGYGVIAALARPVFEAVLAA